jgi:hypothetical protein
MIQYVRPPLEGTFERTVRPHREHIAKLVQHKKKRPDFDKRDVWKDYRAAFSIAQHRKCGYCESKTAANQAGDVEHVAPKGEVWAVPDDESDWGQELEAGLSRLRSGSRKKTVISGSGYWFLAYDWTNYLFACAVCNSKYKLSYFPLHPRPPKRWKPTLRSKKYKPLLLGCFDEPAPWRHFTYDEHTGEIGWATDRGKATIATCGLLRETLRQDRFEVVNDAREFCGKIRSAFRRCRSRLRRRGTWRGRAAPRSDMGGYREARATTACRCQVILEPATVGRQGSGALSALRAPGGGLRPCFSIR